MQHKNDFFLNKKATNYSSLLYICTKFHFVNTYLAYECIIKILKKKKIKSYSSFNVSENENLYVRTIKYVDDHVCIVFIIIYKNK